MGSLHPWWRHRVLWAKFLCILPVVCSAHVEVLHRPGASSETSGFFRAGNHGYARSSTVSRSLHEFNPFTETSNSITGRQINSKECVQRRMRFLLWLKFIKCEQPSSFLLLSSTDTRKIDHGNVLSQRGGVSQYIREAYEHKERKGHPQIAWNLEETISILRLFYFHSHNKFAVISLLLHVVGTYQIRITPQYIFIQILRTLYVALRVLNQIRTEILRGENVPT